MSQESEKILFEGEDGEQKEFYVLEQTTLQGMNYILVADNEDEEEALCLIMREKKSDTDDEYVEYEIVEDEKEIKALSKLFGELLDDETDLEVSF